MQFSTRWPKPIVEDLDAIARERFEKTRSDFPNRVSIMKEAMRLGLQVIRKAMQRGDYRPLT